MVSNGRSEAGKVRLGCLFSLLILASVVFYGIKFVEVRYRFYQMQNEVKQNATFAPTLTDAVIRRRLVAKADTLGIPLGPRQWTIRRTREPREIFIGGTYDDSVVVQLPGWRKVWHFHFEPKATAPL